MTVLLIDSSFLCYRSIFTVLASKELSYEQKPTAVIFGFLYQLQSLIDRFNDIQFIFAWDSKRSYRRDVYPAYKEKPEKEPDDLDNLIKLGREQFAEVRTKVLPNLGFRNNFIQTGVEADDIIAMLILDVFTPERIKTTIVSSDNDFYQLLSPFVNIYILKTKKTYTETDFTSEWGVTPAEWVQVKSIAGCSSDNVKGVDMVGEVTAIKYLSNQASPKIKAKIEAERARIELNKTLIKLPHLRTNRIYMNKDELSIERFENVFIDYGFNTFLKRENFEKWKKLIK